MLFDNQNRAGRLLNQRMADTAHNRSAQGAESARAYHNNVRLRLLRSVENTLVHSISYDHTPRDADIWGRDQAANLLDRTGDDLLSLGALLRVHLLGHRLHRLQRLRRLQHARRTRRDSMRDTQMHVDDRDLRLLAAIGHLGAKTYRA